MKQKIEKQIVSDYLEQHENSETAFVKVGNGSKNLIVSFSSRTTKPIFERKATMFRLKYDTNHDVDFLYMRDMEFMRHGRGDNLTEQLIGGWFLEKLKGVGTCVQDTVSFLKNQTKNYDNVIFIGTSMGGFASILYGSLVDVKHVVSVNPQVDLNWVLENVPHDRWSVFPRLRDLKRCNAENWKKYSNVTPHLRESVSYHLSYLPESAYADKFGKTLMGSYSLILHSPLHAENLNKFKSVRIIEGVRTDSFWKQAEDIEAFLPSLLI